MKQFTYFAHPYESAVLFSWFDLGRCPALAMIPQLLSQDQIFSKIQVFKVHDIFSAMAATRPGERDLLIAGDFNLVPIDLQETIARPVATVGIGSTLNSTGAVTFNVYDHLLVFDVTATHEQLEPARVLDVRNFAATNRAFFQTVSDYLPTVARFRIMADDD